MAQGFTKDQPLDTDVNLGGGSPLDYIAASQKATKTYVDNKLATQDIVKVSKLWESDGGAVAAQTDDAGELTLNGTRDIFPQASANGLNARFERLFGDDKPAVTTDFICDTLRVDDLASNVLGFNTNTTVSSDSYTPSSPFSKSNSGTVYFYVKNSYLRTNSLSGTCTLIWTSATDKRFMNTIGQFMTRSLTTYGGEIRCWGVQSPGGASPYWAVRFILDTTGYPTWPWRIKLAYGTGTTFTGTDGTIVADAPFNVFCDNRISWDLSLRGTGPNYGCVVYYQEIHSQIPIAILDYTVGATINFATAKTIYWHTATSYQEFSIQDVEVI